MANNDLSILKECYTKGHGTRVLVTHLKRVRLAPLEVNNECC